MCKNERCALFFFCVFFLAYFFCFYSYKMIANMSDKGKFDVQVK